MKIKGILLIFAIGCFIILSCELKPSPKVISFLGTDILEIISTPDSVESFKINPAKKGKGEKLGGYPVIKKGPNLSTDQIKLIQSILFNEKTYLFDFTKRSPFLPEYALKFKKGDKEVVLLLCYSADMLSFVYNGQEKLEDFDPAKDKMQKLRDELFPEK